MFQIMACHSYEVVFVIVNHHINFSVNLAYFEPIQKSGMSFGYYLLSKHSKSLLSDSSFPKRTNSLQVKEQKVQCNHFANITTDTNKTDYFIDFSYSYLLNTWLLSSVAGVMFL